jgi:carbamoyltransferase
MSKIYGFYGGAHDASIVYIEDGKIKIAIQEERITRVKSGDTDFSYPALSLEKIQDFTGVPIDEADYLTTATPTSYVFIKDNLGDRQVREFPHHECHAASTYFTSGFSGKCMMVSYDGGGDGNYGDVWLCEDGKMEQVFSMPSHIFGSLANLWTQATSILGWKPHQDEGKVMGMSANGRYDEYLQSLMNQIIFYEEPGSLSIKNAGTDLFANYAFNKVRERGILDSEEGRQNFARAVQDVTENIMVRFIKDLCYKYPEHSKKIGLSGGLFHNVKMNQKINEIDLIDEIYVVPVMGDEGVSLGSAICMARDLGEIKHPFKLDNCFYGLDYNQEEISEAISQYDDLDESDLSLDDLASHIVRGDIVGLFNGKFEYGARALGARSILVNPSDPEMHAKLNERLGRNQVMPFAPAVLSEFSEDLFEFGWKSKYSSEFMTICYTVKSEWRDKISACYHREDKTSRPQLVNKETNGYFWEVINAFYKKTGIPAVLNTSFNGHGEPIIDNPHHAIRHLRNGTIDILVIGNRVLRKK